jgi:hypothetical protein
MRNLLKIASIAFASAMLGSCQTPVLAGDNAFFYAASQPTYVSADGRRTIAFNALMNIYAVTTAAEGGGAPQTGPTLDVDESCGLPGFCVRLMGVAMSGVPIKGPGYADEWTVNSGTFRVVRCVSTNGADCASRLVSFEGKDGVRGWYVLSAVRGVEMFGRLNAAGASEDVFVLFGERGVLFKR